MTSLALRHDGFGYQNCGESHRARAGNRLISAAEDAGETYCIGTAKFEHVYEPDPDAGSADSAPLRGT